MMERDPICGMTVEPARAAAQVVYAGKTYYFCCAGCAGKFRAEPARYLSAAPAAATGRAGALVQFSRAGTASAVPALAVSRENMQAAASPEVKSAVANAYVCPMDPEVREDFPGACPKCGMALEPAVPIAPTTRVEYTCPMHPQIVRPGPGSCPICGMALEPRTVIAEEPENPELVSMTRRFWASVALTIPVLVLGMSDLIPGQPLKHLLTMRAMGWIELALATPVVVWGGWPFFERGWASVMNRSLNMFTLIALGTGTAFLYSVVAVLFPQLFPATFRGANGEMPVYFEAAAAITTLVLLGQVSGIARAQPNVRGDPFPASTFAERCAAGARRWHGTGCAARTYSSRRFPARASRRKSAGGRRGDRRRKFGGRIADDRRANSRREVSRCARGRRNDQRNGHAGDARRTRGRRNASRADCADGERSTTQPGAGAETGGSRGGVFCSGCCADRGAYFCGVGACGPAATHGACFAERRCGTDHCLSLRAGPRDADGDHGGDGTRRDGGHPGEECRSARDAGKSGHRGGGQDRDADGGTAEGCSCHRGAGIRRSGTYCASQRRWSARANIHWLRRFWRARKSVVSDRARAANSSRAPAKAC